MNWFVYLLVSINEKYINHCYVGITTDLQRRLNQHNGILLGGAKHTRAKRPYNICCAIKGFLNKSTALKCENEIKKNNQYSKRKEAMKKYVENNDNLSYISNIK